MHVKQKRRESQTSQSSAVSQRHTLSHDMPTLCTAAMQEGPRPRICSVFFSREDTWIFCNMPQELICSITQTWTSLPSLLVCTCISALLKYPPCPPEQIGGARRQLHPPCSLWGAVASASVCLTAWGLAPPPKACIPLDSQPGQKEKRWDWESTITQYQEGTSQLTGCSPTFENNQGGQHHLTPEEVRQK